MLNFSEIRRFFFYSLLVNFTFAIFLFFIITDDDIPDLPAHPLDRFANIFYFCIKTYSTTGYGDLYPKSTKIRLIMSMYMLIIMSGIISLLFNF